MRNRFNRACNVNANWMIFIKAFKEIKCAHPAGHIVIHCDFLPDNALFFFHGFLCKIRVCNEIKQNAQAVLKSVGALKKIACFIKRGVSVCRSARFSISGKSIEFLAFKKLVLKEMGDSLGHGNEILAVAALKFSVYRAIACADNGISRAVMFLWA